MDELHRVWDLERKRNSIGAVEPGFPTQGCSFAAKRCVLASSTADSYAYLETALRGKEQQLAKTEESRAALQQRREDRLRELHRQIKELNERVVELEPLETEIVDVRVDIDRLTRLNREKDQTIKDNKVEMQVRTEERDQALVQYEFVQGQCLLLKGGDWKPAIERLEGVIRQKDNLLKKIQEEMDNLRKETATVNKGSAEAAEKSIVEKQEEVDNLRGELERVTLALLQKDQKIWEMEKGEDILIDALRAGIKEKGKALKRYRRMQGFRSINDWLNFRLD